MERLNEYVEAQKFLETLDWDNIPDSGEPLATICEALQDIQNYKDLEEQGLLLRLPKEAYFIKNNNLCKGWVQEAVYSVCRKLLLDIRYDDNSLDSYRGYLGNDVFLTKEGAEQKLKEMESGNNGTME